LTPSGRREVAAAALGAICASPQTLDMLEWSTTDLAPEQDPAACGTRLCLAGWVAHLLGYSIEGETGEIPCNAMGVSDHVFHVAMLALELTRDQALRLFHTAEEPLVLNVLREMAAGRFSEGFFNDH
jgi:hypothetical protein